MKKIVAPLQAFAALFLCSGMAWMVFVLVSINPVPPTANDLQARSTQDLSFVDMNSTAVALAGEMLADMVPSPSGRLFLPVTGKETATPIQQAVVTLKSVDTVVVTLTPRYITLTPTREKKDRAPTATSTPAPTQTPRPTTTIPANTPSKTNLPTQTAPAATGTATDLPTTPPATEPPTQQPTDPPTVPPTVPPLPTDPPQTDTPMPVVATPEPPTEATP